MILRRVIGVCLMVVLSLVPLASEALRAHLWLSFQDYGTPYIADLPAGPARQPVSARTLVILVRGLRMGESRQLPTLNALRQRGADITVELQAPAYRVPAWVTLATGAPVETHGVTTNNNSGSAPSVDSVFRRLSSVDRASAIVGSPTWLDWYSPFLMRFEGNDEPPSETLDDALVNSAVEVLRDEQAPPQLALVELTALESFTSPLSILPTVDSRINALLNTLDLQRDTVMILSDRGRDERGNDGGTEEDVIRVPMVIAGAGIRAGQRDVVAQTDIAPTLAVLTGAPFPVQSQGVPIWSALDVPLVAQNIEVTTNAIITSAVAQTQTIRLKSGLLIDSARELATYYEHWSEVTGRQRFAAEVLRRYQARLEAGDLAGYQVFVAELRAKATEERDTLLLGSRAARLPLLVGGVICLLALLGLATRVRILLPFLGAALFFAAWYGWVVLWQRYAISLSMFPFSFPDAFLSTASRDASIIFLLVCFILAPATRGHEDVLEAISTMMGILLLILCGAAAIVLWYFVAWGDPLMWAIPAARDVPYMQLALACANALSWRVFPGWPGLPIPVLVVLITVPLYYLMRMRRRKDQVGQSVVWQYRR